MFLCFSRKPTVVARHESHMYGALCIVRNIVQCRPESNRCKLANKHDVYV